ncbi:MAG: hypothetical protein OHK0022_21870 [Roseiflexaceae bacterium]
MQTATTATTPDRKIGYDKDTRTWTAYYQGEPIQFGCATPSEAQAARDAYLASHRRHHGALPTGEPLASQTEPEPATTPDDLPIDPLTLYAPDGPYPDWEIAPDALERAYALFVGSFGDQPKVMDRAAKALALARDPDAWSIPEPGVLRVRGSRANQQYLVRDVPLEDQTASVRDCTQQRLDAEGTVLHEQPCPDQATRTWVHGGQCKHTICRELIRLAQHLSRGAQATPATPEATVTLSGHLLGLALSIAYLAPAGTAAITIEIHDATLRVSAEGAHQVQLACEAGEGHGALQLTLDVLQQLWADLRPQLPTLRTEALLCHLDRQRGELHLAGPGLDLAVPGRAA